MEWKGTRPLTRIIPYFLLGCFLEIGTAWMWILFVVLPLLFLSCAFFSLHPRGWLDYPLRWIPGAIILAAFFVSATLLVVLSDHRLRQDHFLHHHDRSLIAEVVSVKQSDSGRQRLLVDVSAGRKEAGGWEPRCGKLLLYPGPSADPNTFQGGEMLLISSPLKNLPDAEFPGAFDFQRWGRLRQIYGKVNCGKNGIIILSHRRRESAAQLAARCRNRISSMLAGSGISGQSLALVNALLTGDDDAVDPELVDAFSSTGTLHILSVSGMHVALVYAAIRFFLTRLPRRFRKSVVPYVSITLIWAYAFITGFSPAVQRASATLSLFILAGPLRRPVDSWNLLSGSLLLILSFDPLLIHNAGFQLSYAAVAGILALSTRLSSYFHPGSCDCRIRKDSYCKCSFIRLAGNAIGVTLAAQSFTFPLGFLHFGNFPVYFLPANLLVIPLSTLVLYASMAVLVLSPLTSLAKLAAAAVDFFCKILIRSEYLIGNWPGAVISGVHISGIECMLLYASLSAFAFYLIRLRKSALLAALLFLVLQLAVRVHESAVTAKNTAVISWRAGKGNGCTVICNRRALTLCDSLCMSDTRWRNQRLPEVLDRYGVPSERSIRILR